MAKNKRLVSEPRIRRAATRDINQIIRVHSIAIPYSLNCMLGSRHLLDAYRKMLELRECEVWVVSKARKILAFGVLEYHPQAVANCLLQTRSVGSIILLVLKILQNPRTFLALFQEACSSWVFRKNRVFLARQPHILVIGVDAVLQNLGIGKKLLRVLVVRSKKRHAELLALETRRDNLGSLRFYERNGFKILKKSPADVLLVKRI